MSCHLTTKIQADKILLSLYNLHTLETSLRLYRCLLCTALYGWSACTELHYLIRQHEVPSWLAYQLCFCCQFVCISVWMTWLQELSGHTYLAWNDGWAPCIQYRRRKQQDGSTVVARTFSHSVTCKPQYVCIHRMMVNRGLFVEHWQTFLWKVEDCPHSWVWRSSHSCWHNLNQHAQS